MDNQRAKEIVNSPVMVDVTYNGAKIYMEGVNEQKQTATVHYLNKPDKKLDVSLNSLIER